MDDMFSIDLLKIAAGITFAVSLASLIEMMGCRSWIEGWKKRGLPDRFEDVTDEQVAVIDRYVAQRTVLMYAALAAAVASGMFLTVTVPGFSVALLAGALAYMGYTVWRLVQRTQA